MTPENEPELRKITPSTDQSKNVQYLTKGEIMERCGYQLSKSDRLKLSKDLDDLLKL